MHAFLGTSSTLLYYLLTTSTTLIFHPSINQSSHASHEAGQNQPNDKETHLPPFLSVEARLAIGPPSLIPAVVVSFPTAWVQQQRTITM